MPNEITYRYDGGPKEKIQLPFLPSAPYDQKLEIQKERDRGIVLAHGGSLDDWHERHAHLIEIIDIKVIT